MSAEWAWVAFWVMVTVYIVCRAVPVIMRARAEAKCVHSWEKLREGDVVANIGEDDEHRTGYYTLFRCQICGAQRNYQ